jgi:apolipoprotein N-acyltransferase
VTRLHIKGQWPLPLLSGLLLVLAFPPFKLLLPSFVALVPLLVFIGEQDATHEGRWRATRGALLTGAVYFGLLLYWLVIALIYYSLLAIPAYLGTVAVLTIFTGMFGWSVHYVQSRLRIPLALTAAALWTAAEWLQGHLGDLSFPWLGLGTSLAAFPSLAGAADLVGARGLTFWLAAVNGLLAMILLRWRARRPVRAGLAVTTVVLLVLPMAYGIWRDQTLHMRPVARVAVVQPNIPEDLKMNPRLALDSSVTSLTHLTDRVPRGSVDLIVWPEVAVPEVMDTTSHTNVARLVEFLSMRAEAPIVAGAFGQKSRPGRRPIYYNAAFYVMPDSVSNTWYAKHYLVPFVERVPFINPDWLESITGPLQWFGGLGRGEGAPLMGPAGQRFGVLICYESIFAQLSRRYRREGADYLLNITNDAWYGRKPWYARTSALWQHPSHLVLRAIENRIGIARAANTGISMFVDPRGRTYDRTPLFQPAVRADTVYTTDETTLYTRWGDWLATGATGLAVILVLLAWLSSRGTLGTRARTAMGRPPPGSRPDGETPTTPPAPPPGRQGEGGQRPGGEGQLD